MKQKPQVGSRSLKSVADKVELNSSACQCWRTGAWRGEATFLARSKQSCPTFFPDQRCYTRPMKILYTSVKS